MIYTVTSGTRVEEEGIEGEEDDENNKEAAQAKRTTEEAGIFDGPTNEPEFNPEEQPSDAMPRSRTFYIELKANITELKANQVTLNEIG
ncbi:hypothetical protein TorRG33x02_221000 [Trema orientale]|uniref:Uncharacterized protein n=1 Tax=Trema orientale TaxID=63057 RepID=A0A2P5E984_TREOI|nr:hypothetical protein TorRG33x02_221000 [Trema orientale]